MRSNSVPSISSQINILPLDHMSAASFVGAYSLRKLRTAYTGMAINVRRLTDNAVTDVAFDTTGVVSLNSPVAAGGTLGTFIGTSSAYVAIVYDQSTNGNNGVQSTLAAQPRIYNAGIADTINNNRLAFYFNGNSYFSVPDSTSLQLDTSLSANYIYKPTAWGAVAALLDKRIVASPNTGIHIYIQSNTFGMQWNTTSGSSVSLAPTQALNNPYAFTLTATKSSGVRLYTRATSTNPGTLPIVSGSSLNNQPMLIGGHSSQTAYYFTGYFAEFILVNTLLTVGQVAAIANNQTTFFGF